MVSITLKKELPEEFLSDILITAFDGAYGSSWNWFEPVDNNWLVAKHVNCQHAVDKFKPCDCPNPWISVRVRVRRDEDGDGMTGNRVFDREEGFVIDHDGLAEAMRRIIYDDYVDIWRPATDAEKDAWINKGTPEGTRYRLQVTGLHQGLMVETGETARAYQKPLAEIIAGDMDAGDIDAPFADAIVQVAAFGKVIFG